EYRLTSRGAKGVKTINFTEAKGLLAAALVVKEHQELVFISQNGIVQRTGVRGINRYGRTSQGVRVMKLREGDEVSAVALVVESDAPNGNGNGDGATPVIEAGGETIAVEPAGEDDGDGVVAIEPPIEDDSGGDE
ncbi:MAG TPA: DNA gyrase C-terminal beta-propeller domain-containing protein, partial [Solirubrobacteraceae bacterium]|nr:DNA gyrase C-terminal beta-propeller domain-containing protein [Solirubrobacteraceae bacterium]